MRYEYKAPGDLSEAEVRLGALAADIELIRVQLKETYAEWSEEKEGESANREAWGRWRKRAKFALGAKRAEEAQLRAWVNAEKFRIKENNRQMMESNAARNHARLVELQRALEDETNDCVYALWLAARDALQGGGSLSWDVIHPVYHWLRVRGYLNTGGKNARS